MAPLGFDVVFAADPRLDGASARSLRAGLHALGVAGFAVGFVPLFSADIGWSARRVSSSDDLGGPATLVDPERWCETRLLIIESVLLATQPLAQPLRVRATIRCLRVDQPLVDHAGAPTLDWSAVFAFAEDAFGGPVSPAPVDAGVARQLTAAFPERRQGPFLPARGRDDVHARRDAADVREIVLVGDGWRQEPAAGAALTALCRAHGIVARRPPVGVGVGRPIAADLAVARPPAGQTGLIDAELAEALAAGLPVVGDASYGEALGACLLPGDASAVPTASVDDRRVAGAAAAAFASAFAPRQLAVAVRELIGAPAVRPRHILLRRERQPDRGLVMMSSNGIGVGHLVRGMAVARRVQPHVAPVFFTLSGAAQLAAARGWPVEVFQHAQTYGGDMGEWRDALATRLEDLFALHRPRAFMFDGNYPYQALRRLRRSFPGVWFLWMRRGMWRDGQAPYLANADLFDVVLEPGELAASCDRGPTAEREDAAPLEVVTYLDRDELLSRGVARRRLGIEGGAVAVLVQLGAGNNLDMKSVLAALMDAFGARADLALFTLSWPISDASDGPGAPMRRLDGFPTAHLLPAFDLVVTACGYNSFHEVLQARVPAVFVPNENPRMEAQEVRARWADRRGYGVHASAARPFEVVAAVGRLLDPAERAETAAALAALRFTNGAWAAARLASQLVAGGRALASPYDEALDLPR